MPLSSQKKNFIFITFAIISSIVISIFSYFYFSSVLQSMESRINTHNNSHFINDINRKILNNEHIANDYARDNNLYSLMLNKNTSYFDLHYEKGAFSLKNLNLSFILIYNSKNEALYSHKSSNYPKINIALLKEDIKNIFQKKNITSSLIKINNAYHIVTREDIKSANQNSNGYLYLAKEITSIELKEYNAKIFTNASIQNASPSKANFNTEGTKDFKKILLSSYFDSDAVYNTMHFYDKNSTYSFSIRTKNPYMILEKGKEKILVYNLIIITLLLFVFFLIYKFQKFLNINKKQLERLVDIKTRQTRITLKKLEIAHKKLFTIANTDYLTKINNRRNFFQLSEKEFIRANESEENLSIIMIDIDNFKQINDTYGHDVGDEILKMFVNAFKPHLGKQHIFGRLGGEEFAITLPRCNLEEARIKAEILRAALQQALTHKNTKKIGITASFGVAQMKDDTCIDDVLQTADNLLYAAKKSGKNRVRSRIMPMDKIKEQIQNL